MTDEATPIRSDLANTEKQPEWVSKQVFLICGAIAGLALALTLAGVVLIAISVNTFQSDQIEANRDTNRKQQEAIDGLRRLTNPTKAEYRDQIRAGFRLCAREPLCVKAFRALLDPKARSSLWDGQKGKGRVPRRGSSSGSGGSPTTRQPAGRRPTGPTTVNPQRPSRRPGHRPGGSPGSTPSRPPSSSPSPQPQPSPSPPPPDDRPIDITLDPLPDICIDPLIGINCKRP